MSDAIMFEVQGDLEIVGDDVDQVQAEGSVQVDLRDGAVRVHGAGDGRVRVPRAAALHIVLCRKLNASNLDGALHIARAKGGVTLRDVHDVAGDRLDHGLDAERVRGALNIRAVGGGARLVTLAADAHLQAIGGKLSVESAQACVNIGAVGGAAELVRVSSDVKIDTIGGTLRAQEIGAGLRCRTVGGNAALTDVQGAVHIDNVGGNLSTEGAIGDLAVGNVGGSLGAASATMAGSFALNVGGGASLQVAARADAQITLHAGGSVDCILTLDSDATVSVFDSRGRSVMRAGSGAGRVAIHCAGRVKMRRADGAPLQVDGREEAEPLRRGWFGAFARPARPAPPVPPTPPVPPARNGEPAPSPAPQAAISAEERMAVLRMLAEKKITIEQAEKLLAALE
jgi:hypothetical protein